MSDEKLTQLVAELWVDHGGDVEGFDWCVQEIRNAIAGLIAEREADTAAAEAEAAAKAAAIADSHYYRADGEEWSDEIVALHRAANAAHASAAVAEAKAKAAVAAVAAAAAATEVNRFRC